MQIDFNRDILFDELGLKRLRESYMLESEKSPQERFAFVSEKFSSNPEHAQRLYDYSSKHWLSYSTPILSFGRTKYGLPISCFVGETEINTSEGVKHISELKIGDKVLSHDGTYNEIENISSSESDDIYEICFRGETFYVTGNHLILTREDGWVRVDELDSDFHNIVAL